jgi:FKBP-type peptidyl-prolyl cis-trans isomerase (trigger factor)
MEEESRHTKKQMVQKVLIHAFDFDLPTTLVEREQQHILHNRLLAMKREKLSSEIMEQKKEALKEEAFQLANDELRMNFLSQKLVDQFDIKITMDELQAELQRQMYLVPEGERVVDPQRMQPEQIRQRLVEYLMKDRVKDHLAIALCKEKT